MAASAPPRSSLQSIADHIKAGRLEDAAQQIAPLLSSYPEHAGLWELDCEHKLRLGKWDDAIAALDRAVAIDGKTPRHLVNKARCLEAAGQMKAARRTAEEAIRAGVTKPDQLVTLGYVLSRCGAYSLALSQYEAALAQNPTNTDALRGRVAILRFSGRLGEAEKACDKLIALDPHDYEMINLRSSLRKQTRASNHIADITKLLQTQVRDWRGAVQLAYALFKEYDDLGDYDKAFYHLENGARIKRLHTIYDVDKDVAIFDRIIEAYSQENIRACLGSGNPERAPIFVLGMPRTGSTLVERIISGHSLVESAGELNDFALAMVKLLGKVDDRLDLPQATLSLDFKALGSAYLSATMEVRNKAPYFIDKLPLNSLYIGLIHLALPNAKIVHVKRHPVASCFAIYAFLFAHAYPFSYELRELARYYAGYNRLMQHWQHLLPCAIHDVRYEALIADPEAEARALLAFLDLKWEDQCLHFHANPAVSTTGSASQIRQPLYQSSVAKWRRYEKHLAPLKDALREFGVTLA